MKLGICGSGKIVQELLPVLDMLRKEGTGFEQVYLYGRRGSQEKVEKLAFIYGIDRVFYDYLELLLSDVDLIYIALPNDLHFPCACMALTAGKHVVVEKPITVNSRQCEILRKLAGEKGLFLLEAMNLFYLPAFREIERVVSGKTQEEFIQSGGAGLGQVRIVSMNYSQYSSRYDAFLAGEVKPCFDPAKAGGALMDLGVYNLAFLVALFGKPKAISYRATLQRGIDTSGILTMDYGSFQAACIGAKDSEAPVTNTIQGEKGSLVINSPVNRLDGFTLAPVKGEAKEYSFPKEHRMASEFRAFRRMIEEGDHETEKRYLEVTSIVQELMEEAREQAGITFPGEER